MNSIYKCEWLGSTDPADKAGTATFAVEGEALELRLDSFDQFRAIGKMLELANKKGKTWAARNIANAVVVAMRERIVQIAPEEEPPC